MLKDHIIVNSAEKLAGQDQKIHQPSQIRKDNIDFLVFPVIVFLEEAKREFIVKENGVFGLSNQHLIGEIIDTEIDRVESKVSFNDSLVSVQVLRLKEG